MSREVSKISPAGSVRLESFVSLNRRGRKVHREVIFPPGTQPSEPISSEKNPLADLPQNPHLKRLALAVYWHHLLETGQVSTMAEIARAEGVSGAWVSRVVGCHG